MTNPYSIMCFWKYKKPKDELAPHKRLWTLVDTVKLDDDCRFINKPTAFIPADSRNPWDGWMNKKLTSGDRAPILGRAITRWCIDDGAHLVDFHPPEFVPWLSTMFVTELKKLANWCSFLEDGNTLFLGTCTAAADVIFGKPTP